MKVIRFLVLVWFLALSLDGYAQNMIMVKTYDKNMRPLPGIGLSLDGAAFQTTKEDGTLYLELASDQLPPKSIAVNQAELEAESWNYSKGVLEVIVRKKSYRMTTVVIKDRFGKTQAGLNVHLQTPEPVHKTSDAQGQLDLPTPLHVDLATTPLLEIPGFSIRERKMQKGQMNLIVDPIVIAQPLASKTTSEPFDLADLDSIQSLTVFYGFIKNVDVQKLSEELRAQIDAKFYELMSIQNDSLGLLAIKNPVGKISDSSLVGEDISLLIDLARIEEQNLNQLKVDFDQKIALISGKLVGGGSNLDAASRQDLLLKIEQLDNILTKNGLIFSTSKNDYHTILTSMRNRLLNIEDLEKQLTDVQKERQAERKAFQKRLLIISLVLSGLALISVLLLFLLKKINRQKKEINLAHQELNQVNEHLEDLVLKRTLLLKKTNEELDTFMYRASHDLRRPITSILGLVQIAKMTLQSESLELFERVASTARSMDRMLQKLIMVSHINQTSETTSVNIEELPETYHQRFEGLMTKYGMELEWDIQKGLTHETCPVMLDIILRNLLENSLRFSSVAETQIKPRVLVNIHSMNDHLVIEVEDNAGGIAPEVQPKIWNMFYVGNEASKGNGLGLYVARRAVDKLGAEINFECNGKKTVFTVRIPSSKIRHLKIPELVAV